MIEFIPVEYYGPIFYNLLLVAVLLVFSQSRQYELEESRNIKAKRSLGLFLLFFIIIFMGLRPITFNFFGDMGMYNIHFKDYAEGAPLDFSEGKDKGFELFMKTCSYLMTPEFFFLVIAFLYVFPMYVVSKKLFQDYWFYAFFMLVISFSFWGYGTNGLRNGMATSFFLLAFALEKKYAQWLVILLAITFHKSLATTALAFLAVTYYKDTKSYMAFWFLAIPLSLIMGSFWEGFFLQFGFGDEEKIVTYLTEDEELMEQFTKSGFRWDFLLYSATGVFAGWYFIFKQKFDDVIYNRLYHTYLITNAFWILIIRANFSNRFAYLSWFMLGLLIIYPLLKVKFSTRQHWIIGNIVLVYFMFTYLMNVILSKY